MWAITAEVLEKTQSQQIIRTFFSRKLPYGGIKMGRDTETMEKGNEHSKRNSSEKLIFSKLYS